LFAPKQYVSPTDFAEEALLNNPERMLELHHNTREWWHKIYSEEAMAAYVATQLANL
jgi:hypothetical protein